LRLLSKDLTTFEKAVLIAVGVGCGLFRGLRALGGVGANNSELGVVQARIGVVQARIDAVTLAVARLGEQAEQFHARLDSAVTHEELSRTVDRVLGKLEGEVDARFELQTRSVEALRLMVGQTDELLQKVLDGLEAIGNDRDPTENPH
jgi:hypothetical protein